MVFFSEPLPEEAQIEHLHFSGLILEVKKRKMELHKHQDLLHYSTQHHGSTLLANVEGEVKSGQVLAIFGGSGCGKTLLLRMLAGRPLNPEQYTASGTVVINNGKYYRSHGWHRKASFVQRSDELYPKLTVREAVTYAAKLKIGNNLLVNEHVEQALRNWSLEDLAEQYIENIDNEVPSLGNRKRVAIAIHCVHNPDVILLDEPTVGLDPRREEKLMSDLNRYAAEHDKIVIIATNPTRSRIYDFISKIAVLCHGQTAFFGTVEEVVHYFQNRCGYPYFLHENLTDFLVNIVTVELRSNSDLHKDLDRLRDDLRNYWNLHRSRYFTTNHYIYTVQRDTNEPNEAWPNSRLAEFTILLRREMIGLTRDYPPIIFNVLQRILVFTLLSFIYFQLPNYPPTVRIRPLFGLFAFIPINQASLVLAMTVPSVGYVRRIIYRERLACFYRSSSIYAARIVSELPVNFIATLVYSFVLYYVCGLRRSFNHFLIFMSLLFLEVYAILGLGILVSSVAKTRKARDVLSIIIFLVMFMFGGNQIQNRLNVPWVLRWMQFLSPIFYTYIGLIRNEFQANSDFEIPGDRILKEYGVAILSTWSCFVALFSIGTICFIFGYFALRITTRGQRYIF